MAEITLKAETGRELGSGPSKRIRAEGRIPGVVYGLGTDPTPIVVEWKPLREALTTEAGLNALIQLEVDGNSTLTIVKELQRHPIKGDVIHLDFLRASADAEISVDVPVVLTGEAEDVERQDGTIDHLLFTLTVNAKPADIPNEISIDISSMQLGDAIRVGDVILPSGVSTDVDPEEAIVTAAISATTMEADAIAEADAEAAAEQSDEAEGGDAEGADEGEGGGDADAGADGDD
ncbi:MAG TPA: 50S ribosomal protein L25 [Aquihabitans sp.]|nr:50S ribosomal protein L25 [Aquihabitans sp.]